jgi:DNA-binding LacI/PurR family transcriptional regulator
MRRLGLADNAHVTAGDFTEEAGAHAVERLLRGVMPTAIFTANDLSAVGAIDAVERGGLVVPDDVAVVGFDNTSLAALNHIGLTTIDQPNREMGEAAARMLIDAINDRGELTDVVMSPTLVVRRTSSSKPGHLIRPRRPTALLHRLSRSDRDCVDRDQQARAAVVRWQALIGPAPGWACVASRSR